MTSVWRNRNSNPDVPALGLVILKYHAFSYCSHLTNKETVGLQIYKSFHLDSVCLESSFRAILFPVESVLLSCISLSSKTYFMFQELLYANVSKIPFHETSANGVIWGKASQGKMFGKYWVKYLSITGNTSIFSVLMHFLNLLNNEPLSCLLLKCFPRWVTYRPWLWMFFCVLFHILLWFLTI